ncbi:MAG: hypothetical protein DDT18_01149 [Actinobacteria bacterium]|nr:hypothetical protein [Actinomycetota bacterium]
MKVQKRTNIQGGWARPNQDIFDKDIIKILDEGQDIEGKFGTRKGFKVETKTGIKVLTFNQTTINNLVDAFGDETKNWIGKKVKVWIIKANVAGKMRNVVYLTDVNWTMGEDGFLSG